MEFTERMKCPVPDRPTSWPQAAVPLEECGEPLVPASLFPSKILVRSWYFGEGLPGSLPEAWLREGVFDRLIRAARKLPEGWHFVVWDGWRSPVLQGTLFNILLKRIRSEEPGLSEAEAEDRAGVFVAFPSKDPMRLSGHFSGGAVDLTIADDSGRYLDMGGGFDEPTERSFTDHYENAGHGHGHVARDNRRLLVSLMGEAGFDNYPQEWWHYDYGNRNWAIRTGAKAAIYGYAEPPFRWREDL